jgi:hypothetical protein
MRAAESSESRTCCATAGGRWFGPPASSNEMASAGHVPGRGSRLTSCATVAHRSSPRHSELFAPKLQRFLGHHSVTFTLEKYGSHFSRGMLEPDEYLTGVDVAQLGDPGARPLTLRPADLQAGERGDTRSIHAGRSAPRRRCRRCGSPVPAPGRTAPRRRCASIPRVRERTPSPWFRPGGRGTVTAAVALLEICEPRVNRGTTPAIGHAPLEFGAITRVTRVFLEWPRGPYRCARRGGHSPT